MFINAKQAPRRITATMCARAYYALSLCGCAIVSTARSTGFYTSDNPTDKLSTLMLESRRVKANKAECECFLLVVILQRCGNECKVEWSTMRQNHRKLRFAFNLYIVLYIFFPSLSLIEVCTYLCLALINFIL